MLWRTFIFASEVLSGEVFLDEVDKDELELVILMTLAVFELELAEDKADFSIDKELISVLEAELMYETKVDEEVVVILIFLVAACSGLKLDDFLVKD